MNRNRNRASFGNGHGFGKRKWNRSSNGGSYSYPKSFTAGRRISQATKSELGDDVSVFIKKAVEVSTESTYTPHNSFADFDINPALKQNIINKGYIHPTPIQDKAIQPILEGRDLIGLANTGTGKTAAFLIPLINKIVGDRSRSLRALPSGEVQKALIITPTRELATQINEELRSFSRGMNIYSALVIGGNSAHRQIADIRKGASVVIGTPGRLRDLIGQRILNLQNFRTIVLDEVDLMVDIGFINDVKYFISLLPRERQSLFFSATIPPKVNEVLNAFVSNPVTVSVQQQATAENIDQNVVKVVSREKKIEQLHDLLNGEEFNKVMIFGRTKHGVERLSRQLIERGFKAGAIHGNRSQAQRQRVLKSFKQNEIQILLATDVASRGLDIDNVSHVINYDLPETYDDYVHRIGRTGRANKKGVALTFVE